MWIRKITVSSFGALKDREFEFEKGFNYIKEDNEFGKTTLINLIHSGFYGFTSPSKYPYKPLNEEATKFDIDMDISGQEVYLHRELKKNGKGSINCLDQKVEIKNKTFTSGLDDLGFLSVPNTSASSFIIDSDSIEEMKRFTKSLEKIDITSYQALDYNGLSIEDAIKVLSDRAKKLYTKTSTSVSLYRKVMDEFEIQLEIKKQITEFNQRTKDKRDELSNKLYHLSKINSDIANCRYEQQIVEAIKTKETLTKKQKEIKTQLLDYSFDENTALKALMDYETLKLEEKDLRDKIDSVKTTLKHRIEADLSDRERLIIQSENENASTINSLEKRLELKVLEKNLYQKKLDIEQHTNFNDNIRLIDKDKVTRELNRYHKLLSDTEELRNQINKNFQISAKKLLLMLLPLCIAIIMELITKHSMLNNMIWGTTTLFYLLVVLLPFLNHKSRNAKLRDKLQKLEDELGSFQNSSDLEVAILNTAKSRMMLRNKFSKEDLSELYHTIDSIDQYFSLKQDYKVKKDTNLATPHADLSFIDNMSEEELSKLITSAKIKLKVYNRHDREKEILQSTIIELELSLEEKIKELNEVKSMLITYFGTEEPSAIRELINKKQKLIAVLQDREQEQNAFIENNAHLLNSSMDDLKYFNLSELNNEKEQLIDEIARLEEALKTPPEYEISDVQSELERLRLEGDEILKEYDRTTVMIKILEETRQTIKNLIQPSYIKRANDMINKLIEGNVLEITSDSSKNISFYNHKYGKEISFSQLSSATKAQCILALKLSYLDEIDQDKFYPLIIDDAFMSYDSKRHYKVIDFIREIAEERQVILFSRT